MARLPRFFAPDVPLHVVQRGNDRRAMFRSAADFAHFMAVLSSASAREDVAIHAYVLMNNHVHLLVTPARPTSLPRMMQALGRSYVPRFNEAYHRTGSLWEGRYKAAVIDSERYLLTCMRYIESNPVRAGIVSDPSLYRWSSFRSNALGRRDEIITPSPYYLALGATRDARLRAYVGLFGVPIDASDFRDIREATQNAWALGDEAFRARVDGFGRRSTRLPPGRPRTRK